jgi:hypothetical protein
MPPEGDNDGGEPVPGEVVEDGLAHKIIGFGVVALTVVGVVGWQVFKRIKGAS